MRVQNLNPNFFLLYSTVIGNLFGLSKSQISTFFAPIFWLKSPTLIPTSKVGFPIPRTFFYCLHSTPLWQLAIDKVQVHRVKIPISPFQLSSSNLNFCSSRTQKPTGLESPKRFPMALRVLGPGAAVRSFLTEGRADAFV